MTAEDAHLVAMVIAKVDGGCHQCVQDATKELIAAIPYVDWDGLVALEGKRQGHYWAMDDE